MCGFPYVHRCTYTFVCRYVKVKVTVRCQSSGVIHLVLQDMDFPWDLGFAKELSWMAKEHKGFCRCLPSAEITSTRHKSSFYNVGTGDRPQVLRLAWIALN